MVEDNKNESKNVVANTYAEDMARAIENGDPGIVRKLILAEEQKEKLKEITSPESEKNKIYMTLSIVLVGLAMAALSVVFFREKNVTVPLVVPFKPIVFSDKSFFVEVGNLTKDQMIESFLNEVRASDLKPGSLEGIYFTQNSRVVGLREFIKTIGFSLALPEKELVYDNFLMGSFVGDTKDFFILVQLHSFVDIFESMKKWESKMLEDVYRFIGLDLNSENSYLLTKSFENGFVENRNARILYDKDGREVIMYVYANENSLVISSKKEAVKELIDRLARGPVEN